MTTMPATRTLTDWLDALIIANPADRRMLAIQAADAGVGLKKVRCARHDVPLNVLSAFRHLERTEASHRLQHGPSARLHVVGDLVALPSSLTGSWPTGECRWCGQRVIWAVTSTERRIPIDLEPNPAGNVVLANQANASDRPLAIVLHTEYARATTPDDAVFTSHMKTCPARPSTVSGDPR